MHPDIIKATQAVEDARNNWRVTIHRIQRVCPHLHLGETDGEYYTYQPSVHPVRVCRDCGMTEAGAGAGYVVLKGEAERIENSVLWQTQIGLRINHEMKGRIIRKEITVAQLVDELFTQ